MLWRTGRKVALSLQKIQVHSNTSLHLLYESLCTIVVISLRCCELVFLWMTATIIHNTSHQLPLWQQWKSLSTFLNCLKWDMLLLYCILISIWSQWAKISYSEPFLKWHWSHLLTFDSFLLTSAEGKVGSVNTEKGREGWQLLIILQDCSTG